jgi:hypothetical protein
MVAQVDEDQVAMIALLVHPARYADGVADVAFAERGAVVGAIGVHSVRLALIIVIPAKAGISGRMDAAGGMRCQLSLA